jgi:hypothetical protein
MDKLKNSKILELLYQLLIMKLERERKENTDGQNQEEVRTLH